MTVTTPHVGVRTFLDRTDAIPLIIADMSTIGGVFEPVADMDRTFFPVDTPVSFYTNDPAAIAAAGAAGTLRQTIDAITAEGIVATVTACVPEDFAANATLEQKMAKMVGSPSGKTGAWALLDAESETGVVPDILIGPGYTSQRLGDAANPLATAFDAISERLLTAVAVCDTPSSTKEAAVEWAGDFTDSLNIIAVAQGVKVSVAGSPIVRPASPSVAALIAKTDKEEGAPYYNPGNRSLIGILGPSRAVGFSISDPDSEANYLIQRGVNSLVQVNRTRTSKPGNVQGKTFWGFFNTSDDPLWRAINVVRTRKAVREVIPRTLVKYAGQNLGPHLVTVIMQSLEAFLSQLKSLPKPAILGGEVVWDRKLNDNATLRTGGLSIKLNFEEAPPLTDIRVYTGRYEAAFNILADEIRAAMSQAGVGGQI